MDATNVIHTNGSLGEEEWQSFEWDLPRWMEWQSFWGGWEALEQGEGIGMPDFLRENEKYWCQCGFLRGIPVSVAELIKKKKNQYKFWFL